jgi:heavy metal sensor kinase
MNTRSIYFRLVLWYSSSVILISLAFGAYVYDSTQSRLYEEIELGLIRNAHQIAEKILVQVHNKTPEEIAEQIRATYSPAANSKFIRILRSDNSVLYTSIPSKNGKADPPIIPLPNPLWALRWEKVKIFNTYYMLVVQVPVMVAREPFLIEMGAPIDALETVLNGLVLTLLFGLPIVVIIVSAGGYVLVRRSLKPVESIRATAEQITFGNLSNRLPVVATSDELENLSITLNQMLERLDNAYQRASRFSADASHELRTPLAIMRAELESLLQRESELPADMRGHVSSMLEEAERLSHITESLFAISRMDAGEAGMKPAILSLVDLVMTTRDHMLLLAEEKNIRIKIDAKQAVKVKGDAARLKQVIVNLLDNAIKYTPAAGRIFIKIYAAGNKAVLEINDTGCGIPESALPHIFERFYRADKVRSRDQGGAGLGLSIVRAICQAHGGTIEIESVENQGTRCRVELPLAGEAEV